MHVPPNKLPQLPVAIISRVLCLRFKYKKIWLISKHNIVLNFICKNSMKNSNIQKSLQTWRTLTSCDSTFFTLDLTESSAELRLDSNWWMRWRISPISRDGSFLLPLLPLWPALVWSLPLSKPSFSVSESSVVLSSVRTILLAECALHILYYFW